jgi:hypothetical protein
MGYEPFMLAPKSAFGLPKIKNLFALTGKNIAV